MLRIRNWEVRMALNRVSVFIALVTLLGTTLLDKPAEAAPIDFTHAVWAAALPKVGQTASRRQSPSRTGSCSPLRHAVTGAAIGFVAGMVIVRRIAAEEGSASISAKNTLGAGAYGAAIGGAVGLGTCH